MSPYHEQVAAALAVLEVRSHNSYSWLGQVFEGRVSPDGAPANGTDETWLARALHARLYADFYLLGAPAPASEPQAWRIDLGRLAVADQLAAANAGRGAREAGWRVRRHENGAIVVRHEGLEVWAQPGDIDAGSKTAIGAEVAIRLPKERVAPNDAFYTALGDKGQGAARDGIDRFYWDVRPPQAALLVAEVTETLNGAAVPFRFKVVNDPRALRRGDSGVLYTRREDRPVMVPLVLAMRGRLAAAMREAVPAMTLRLAPGLGFAEDPGGGESYGSHRCRLIARGRHRRLAPGEGAPRASARAGGRAVPGRRPRPPATLSRARLTRGSGAAERDRLSELLETALGIGNRLTSQAVWYGSRCAWLGIVPSAAGRRGPRVAAALGPGLYEGTGGVALALAHLARATGDRDARRTGLGAIRHALSRAGEIPPAQALSLYTGRLGIALAAARCRRLCEDEEIAEHAQALADGLLSAEDPPGHDLISGSAGAVVGLLALGDELDDPRQLERARRLGRRAATAARAPGLTGMAHGAAGMVHALLELAAADGDGAWLSAAAQAVAYERSLFDSRTGNWPDLRERSARDAGDVGAASGVAWCHGAPGVVLSRRRARGFLGTAEDAEIAAGAATTARWIRAAVGTRRGNFSLCHGLAGNAESLLDGSGGSPPARDLALEVAELGAAEHGHGGSPWPGGTPGGETPPSWWAQRESPSSTCVCTTRRFRRSWRRRRAAGRQYRRRTKGRDSTRRIGSPGRGGSPGAISSPRRSQNRRPFAPPSIGSCLMTASSSNSTHRSRFGPS